jgi:hypothetical protein
MFSLIIVEMPLRGSVKSALKGPWLFPSEYAAENALFRRVVENMMVTCVDDFLESAPDLDLPEWVYCLGIDEDGNSLGVPMADLEIRLDALKREEKKRVVDWYFNLINGNLCEAYYEIKTHVRPYDTSTFA